MDAVKDLCRKGNRTVIRSLKEQAPSNSWCNQILKDLSGDEVVQEEIWAIDHPREAIIKALEKRRAELEKELGKQLDDLDDED